MTREKIINMLAQRIVNSKKITTMQGAVEYVLQYTDEHPKNPWRDAKTDPPEDMKPVIGYADGIIEQYEYFPEEKIWSLGLLISNAPEYWIPIPETPKGKEE